MSAVLALAIGLASVLTTITVAVALSLVTSEARGSVPAICKRLLDRTASRLPAEMRDRREEWERELRDAKERPISQLAIALRIWNSGRALAREANAAVAEAEKDGQGEREADVAQVVLLLALLRRPVAVSLDRLGTQTPRLPALLESGARKVGFAAAGVATGVLFVQIDPAINVIGVGAVLAAGVALVYHFLLRR